jgi:hypothetical protein
MSLDDLTPENERGCTVFALRPEVVFFVLSSLFIGFFWIWFLFLRSPTDGVEKEVIHGKAVGEILAVCNAAMANQESVFDKNDVKIQKSPPLEGVSAMVSMLEVSKNGFACRWDGINAATVMHQAGAEQ